MDHDTGVFTGKIIRMISDIRAKHGKDSVNLDGCGKFTLAEDLSDISDMTSIDLSSINSLEGRCYLKEPSFPRMRTSPQFLKKFLLSESCSNFLDWLAELEENSWKFPRSLQTLSLTYTCPACLSIRFHTGDIQVLGNCTQLMSVDFRHCSKITGGCSFEECSFLRLRTSAPFLEEFSFLRNLREFSRVARRTCRNFLEFFSLYSTL